MQFGGPVEDLGSICLEYGGLSEEPTPLLGCDGTIELDDFIEEFDTWVQPLRKRKLCFSLCTSGNHYSFSPCSPRKAKYLTRTAANYYILDFLSYAHSPPGL